MNEVNRWTCIQEPLIHRISPGRLNADTRSRCPHPRAGGKAAGMVGVRLGVKQTGCAGFGYVSTVLASRTKTICCLNTTARTVCPAASDAVY